jgi:hypothetical protein
MTRAEASKYVSARKPKRSEFLKNRRRRSATKRIVHKREHG